MLLAALIVSMAGMHPVESAIVYQDNLNGDWLQYDNGTPRWFTWTGTYRGVWFNTADFFPPGTPFQVGTAQIWFYHRSINPWDTSQVTVELWNGDASTGPEVMLGSVQGLGIHFCPVYFVWDPMVEVEENFWCLINTEASSGGWPSILGDDGDYPYIQHSFHSDDFLVWEPFEIGHPCNYFIAVVNEIYGTSLDRVTWAELKTVF